MFLPEWFCRALLGPQGCQCQRGLLSPAGLHGCHCQNGFVEPISAWKVSIPEWVVDQLGLQRCHCQNGFVEPISAWKVVKTRVDCWPQLGLQTCHCQNVCHSVCWPILSLQNAFIVPSYLALAFSRLHMY